VADYTRQLSRQLRSRGVRGLICTAHTYSGGDVVGVTDRWDAAGVVRAARAMGRLRLDLIHVQFAPSAFGFHRAVGLLPGLLGSGTPLLATLHEYGVWTAEGPAGRLREAGWSAVERRGVLDRETLLLTLRASQLLFTAPEHEQVLRARFPGRTIPATYSPIGANIPLAAIEDRAVAAVRAELGLPGDARLAVFFGFLHQEKGLERLIEAVAQVRRTHPRLELVLAGGEQSHSVVGGAATALRRSLEQVAERHGVEHAVRFTGYLPERAISALLQAADVAVFPFNAGVTSKSSSLLAALSHGVPTIATAPTGAVRAPSEIDGVLRVPPRDTAALEQALHDVLSDSDLAARLVTAGRANAAGRTWQAVAAIHEEVYAEVLGRLPRR